MKYPSQRWFAVWLGGAAAISVAACGGHVSLGGDPNSHAGGAGMPGHVTGYSTNGAGSSAFSTGGSFPVLPACPSDSDESWIAFDSDRDDFDRELYLVHPDGSQLTRLTDRVGVDQQPAFSPNGGQLAFTSDRDGSLQIYMLDLATGDVTGLTHRAEGANQASFSHDGQLVAFHSALSTYTISPDGSNERLVAGASDLLSACEWPKFSKDDRQLIFDRGNRIDVAALDGSATRMVVNNWTTTIESPALSPTGVDVAYQVACDSPTLSIWSAPYALTTDPCAGVRITRPGTPRSEHPSWGPGDRIAYASIDVARNVGQIAIVSRQQDSTACAATRDDADNRNPAWYVAMP